MPQMKRILVVRDLHSGDDLTIDYAVDRIDSYAEAVSHWGEPTVLRLLQKFAEEQAREAARWEAKAALKSMAEARGRR